MAGQQLPPAPNIVDGDGRLQSDIRGVFLDADIGVRINTQIAEDGTYRTSVLSIGHSTSVVDIFAERDQMERLHRLIGQHLQQLDEYETNLGIYHASNVDRGPEGQP